MASTLGRICSIIEMFHATKSDGTTFLDAYEGKTLEEWRVVRDEWEDD